MNKTMKELYGIARDLPIEQFWLYSESESLIAADSVCVLAERRTPCVVVCVLVLFVRCE